MSVIRRYEGVREYMLFRKEPGFEQNQRVWIFDVFTYQELMGHLDDGWRVHNEEKRKAAYEKKITA